MNYEQAMEYIHAVQWAGHKPGLTRTRTLLAALGGVDVFHCLFVVHCNASIQDDARRVARK